MKFLYQKCGISMIFVLMFTLLRCEIKVINFNLCSPLVYEIEKRELKIISCSFKRKLFCALNAAVKFLCYIASSKLIEQVYISV